MSRAAVQKQMPIKRETLAQFVKRTRATQRLSLKDVQLRSDGQITNGYIWNIEHGKVLCPSSRKIAALAKGLGISEDELNTRSRGIAEPDGFTKSRFWELYKAYEQLKEPIHKKTVDYYLRHLVEMMKPLPKK
jgi:transcriptional regulator with XRE-family HTH domain